MEENTKRRRRTPRRQAQAGNTITNNPLKLLVTVVDRPKTEFYADLIQSFDVNLQTVVLAKGTADDNMLRYLGLTDSKKSVIFSVIGSARLPAALETLEDKFRTVKNGKGIAFTIPLLSVIGTLIYGFLSNNRSVVKEK